MTTDVPTDVLRYGKHDDGRPSEYMASFENSKFSAKKPNVSGTPVVRDSWLQKLDEWTFTDRGVFEVTQPAKGSAGPHTIHNAPYKGKLDSAWKTKHWGSLHKMTYEMKKPNPWAGRNLIQSSEPPGIRKSKNPANSKENFGSTYKTEFKEIRAKSEPALKPKDAKQNKVFEEWRNPPQADDWKMTDRGIWELVSAKDGKPVADTKNHRPIGLIDPDWKSKAWGSLYRTMYTQKIPNPGERRYGSHTKTKEEEPVAGKYLPHGGYVSDYRGHFRDVRPQSVPDIKGTKQNRAWLKAQTQGSWKFTDRGVWEQFSATGKNLTQVSNKNLEEKWQTKHWGSLSRTQHCEKTPYKEKRHSLKSAEWMNPNHPFWKDKPQPRAPVKKDTEYGGQFTMPPEGWSTWPPEPL